MADSLANLSPAVMCKVENMPNELGDLVKAMSSQNMLKMSPGFSLLLIVKCEREEIS